MPRTQASASRVLTDRMIKSATPPEAGRAEYKDASLPGFALRVRADGERNFTLRFRSPLDGKQKRMTWPYPEYSLKEAREKAREAKRQVADGEVPLSERDEAKLALVAKRALALPRTMDELCDRYIERHLKRNVRRWRAARGEIDNHIRPHLGSLEVSQIGKAHVRDLLEQIAEKHPIAANRTLQRLRAVFNWGIEQDLISANPTAGLKKPSREKPASRILDPDEMIRLWHSMAALSYPAQQYMKMLLLTGQRRDDIRLMHWSEINLKLGNWLIPRDRYKGGKDHLIPLTDRMLTLLADMPFRDREGYVFSASSGENPYANLTKPKNKLDHLSAVTDWTLHDIRRTVRTGLSMNGIRPDIAERVIGHNVGGRLGETYDVYSYRSEKLEALEVWDAYLTSALADTD